MSTYVMRWNPAISSTKIEEIWDTIKKSPNGFYGNWSIYELEKASVDDEYIMVRVGDGPCGVVWLGYFNSEPYQDEDWAGTDKKRYYVDISI